MVDVYTGGRIFGGAYVQDSLYSEIYSILKSLNIVEMTCNMCSIFNTQTSIFTLLYVVKLAMATGQWSCYANTPAPK